MSYVLQIVVGQLVADDDHQYEQLSTARTHAVKAAQAVMREWLHQGKRIPAEACIGILDENGYLAETVLFQDAAFAGGHPFHRSGDGDGR